MPNPGIQHRGAGMAIAAFVAGLVLMISTLSTLSAQQSEQTDPATADQPSGPEPIVAADIPSNAKAIRDRIREIEAELESTPEQVEAVRSELPELTNQVAEMLSDPSLTNLEDLSSRELQTPRQSWMQLQGDIDRSQVVLNLYVERLDTQRQELRDAQALWDATGTLADEHDFPPALNETIDLVRAEAEKSDARVRDRQGEIVTMQNRLSEHDAQVSLMIASIDQAILRKQQRIFRPDSPPLWSVFSEPADERQPALEYARESWRRMFENGFQYLFAHYKLVLLHLLIFIALAAFIISQKDRRAAQAAVDPEYAKRTRAFDSPLSGAFVVAMVVSQAIYVDPPRSFVFLMLLASLPPLARALPNIMPDFLHRTAYIIVGLQAFFLIREVTLDTTLFDRLTLLVLTGFGLWYLLSRIAFYRHVREKLSVPQDDREPTDDIIVRFAYSGLLQWAMKVALGIIVLSIIANIVGSVEFADILTRGLVIATFISGLLYVAWDVLTASWRIFLRTGIAQYLHSTRRNRVAIRDSGLFLLKWLAIVAASVSVLRAFDLSVAAYGWLNALFEASLQVGAIDISVREVVVFVFAIWLTLFVARVVKALLINDVLARMRLPRGVPATVSTLVNYVILAVGFFAAFAAAGIQLGNLTLLAGALGVGIGFGLQNIVNNFVSGLILVFERPIQVGDMIQLTDLFGSVRHIGIRASTVRTFDGAEVIVPNGNLISSEVINWTLSDKERRIVIPVGVAYGSDPNKVIELLAGEIAKHDSVMNEPEPQVLFSGFGDSSLDFLVRCWTPDSDNFMATKSDLCIAINNVLAKNGIQIPFPQRDLHLRSVDELAGKSLSVSRKPEKLSKAPTARRKSAGKYKGESDAFDAPDGDE